MTHTTPAFLKDGLHEEADATAEDAATAAETLPPAPPVSAAAAAAPSAPAQPDAPQPAGDGAPEPQPTLVPVSALRDTREKLQEERRQRETLQRQLDDIRQRIGERGAEPDLARLMQDPQAYTQAVVGHVQRQFEERLLDMNLAGAHRRHGEAFEKAYAALLESGDARLVQSLVGEPDPGEAIVRWYRRQSLVAEIGSDPDAWVRKRYAELVAQATGGEAAAPAAQPASAGQPASANSPPTPPPSLAAAPGTAGALKDQAPESAFAYVFGA